MQCDSPCMKTWGEVPSRTEQGPATRAQRGDTEVAGHTRLGRLLEWFSLSAQKEAAAGTSGQASSLQDFGHPRLLPKPHPWAWKGAPEAIPGEPTRPAARARTAHLGWPPGAHLARASSKGGSCLEVPAASQKTQSDPRDLSPVPLALNPVFSTPGSHAHTHPWPDGLSQVPWLVCPCIRVPTQALPTESGRLYPALC